MMNNFINTFILHNIAKNVNHYSKKTHKNFNRIGQNVVFLRFMCP